MYNEVLKLELENIKNEDSNGNGHGNVSKQYEIRFEDIKKEYIEQRIHPGIWFGFWGSLLFMFSVIGIWGGLKALDLVGAASASTPLDIFISLFLIWLLSKVQ